MNEDEQWMRIAIKEAENAQKEGEVPVGAIIVMNGDLISKAYNQPLSKNDSTAHAEIQAIRKAGEFFNNYRLNGAVMYVTLEPCAMCLGAIMHARLDKIIFGAYDNKTGVCGSCTNLTKATFFSHKIKINGGVLEKTCSKLLKDFFKKRR
jgi:tRNA(adenine34) deaminase